MLSVADHAADRNAAEIDAVIAALAADQADAAALALHPVIGERDLQRGVDGFGAGIGEEDVVEALRRDRREARRQLEHGRMAHLEGRRVVELHQLAVHRLGDLRPGVAGIDAPEAGRAVDHLPAVMAPIVHALGAHEEARRLLELPVGRERHPERFEVVGGDRDWFLHGPTLPAASSAAPSV